MYFKHSAIQFPEDPNEKDENLIEGEYWEFKEPEKVEAWGLMMIPTLTTLPLHTSSRTCNASSISPSTKKSKTLNQIHIQL